MAAVEKHLLHRLRLRHTRVAMTPVPLCVVLLLGVVDLISALKDYNNYQVLGLTIQNNREMETIHEWQNSSYLDFWTSTDVMVPPEMYNNFLNFLQMQNISWTTRTENVQELINKEKIGVDGIFRFSDGNINFNKLYNYNEVVDFLNALSSKYPNKMSLHIIGKSSEGRGIMLVRIKLGEVRPKRPVIFMDGGMHGREWISVTMLMYIISEMLEINNEDMLDPIVWQIIPILNPDGYEFSHSNDRLWSKTRSDSLCTKNGEKKQGVDLNRNFGFHWSNSRGDVSNDPCSTKFAGPTAFSEPESISLKSHIESLGGRTFAYVSFHSYGGVFMLPWGYTDSFPSNHMELENVVHHTISAQPSSAPTYSIHLPTSNLVSTPGRSDDWMVGIGNVPIAFTVFISDISSEFRGFMIPPKDAQSIVMPFFASIRKIAEEVNHKFETQKTDHYLYEEVNVANPNNEYYIVGFGIGNQIVSDISVLCSSLLTPVALYLYSK